MPLPSVPTAITVLNQNWDPNSEITTGNGSGGVKVGWEGDDDASYIVRLVYHPFSEDVILATINTGVGDKSAKIFGLLVTNFEYRIEIRAVNGDGVSATDEVEFTTGNPGDDLLDPTGLAVPSETITGATALLTWTDPNDAEYCYFVELSMGPLTTPIKIQVPLLESEMLLTGLVPGMTYSVRLRASGTGLDPDDNWVAPVEFTTPGATDAITGPALLPLRLGGAVGASFLFSGPGTVRNWGIAGAPSGVVIGVPLWAEDNSNIGALGGNVTASGVFDAEVSAAVVHEGALTLYSFLVRFLVSGGGFLAWLHGDPDRRLGWQRCRMCKRLSRFEEQ